MITEFIFTLLVFFGVDGLAYKFKLDYKLALLANRIKLKALYEMSTCRFCFSHHLAIIPTIITGWIFNFEIYLFVFPLMIAGLDSRLN